MSNSLVVRKNSGNSLTILKSGSLSVSLPPATNATLGGIIVGDNLSITGNGVLSAQPGGVTAFNNRTGNVSLTSSDVTTALAYTPLTSSTPYSNLSFTGTSTANPFTFKVQNANGSRYVTLLSGSSTNQNYADMQWSISNTRANGQTDVYYPFMRLYTSPLTPDSNEGKLLLQYNYTPNASMGPYFNTSIQISQNKAEFYAQTYTWTDNSLLTRFYADTRYLTSANLTYANITGTPTFATVATSGSYTDLSNTPAAYSLPTATNTTLGGIKVGANLSISNGVLSAVSSGSSTTSLPWANITSTPTTLAGYGITDGLTSANAAATYVTSSDANNAFAAKTVAISPGTGLTGGGNLALSRTLSLANTTVTAGSYGSSSLVPVLTVDAQGRLTSVTTAAVSGYTLPTATTSTLGGVRVDGTTITIASGVISAVSSSYTLPMASTTQLGGIKVGSGLSVDQGNGGLNTDVRLTTNTFTGSQNLQDNELIRAKLRDYSETVSSPTISAGTLTLNLETSNIFTVALNAAITTLTISNPPASGSGGSFTLIFTADGTPRSVTWTLSSGVIKWAGAAAAPTITATTGKKDVFCFYTTDGGSNWLGFIGGQNY